MDIPMNHILQKNLDLCAEAEVQDTLLAEAELTEYAETGSELNADGRELEVHHNRILVLAVLVEGSADASLRIHIESVGTEPVKLYTGHCGDVAATDMVRGLVVVDDITLDRRVNTGKAEGEPGTDPVVILDGNGADQRTYRIKFIEL